MNEEEKDNTVENKDSSLVYEYLKEHPPVLIATVSAIVAIFSFAINACIVLYNYRYMQFWGFSVSIAEFKSTNQSIVVTIAIIFIVAMYFMQKYCEATFTEYFCQNIRLKAWRRANRICKKGNARNRKLIKKLNKYKKGDVPASGKNRPNTSSKDDLEEISRQVSENLFEIKSVQNEYRKEKVESFKELCIFLIPCVFVTTHGAMLLFAATGSVALSFWISLILSLVMSFFLILMSYVLAHLFARKELRTYKKQLKDAGEDTSKLMEIYRNKTEDSEESIESENPRFSLSSLHLKVFFSDLRILQGLLSYCLIFILFLLMVAFSVAFYQTKRQSFPVVSYDESSYVIIYQAKDSLYLDKALIDGRSITINATNHLTLSSENIEYQDIKFDTVQITRNKEPS